MVQIRKNLLTKIATFCHLSGLCAVLIFLIADFSPWSIGIGMFLGIPLTLAGVILYGVVLIRELSKNRVQ